MRYVTSFAVLGALFAGGITLFAQATFKGSNRTVAVYATVTSLDGSLVTHLSQKDFRVEDNGKVADLTVFANDLQPITVVMLLDRSASMRRNFELVEKAAEAFVADLGPGDKARIGSFSNRIEIDPQTFTSDKDELVKILRTELQEEGPTPLWNAINVGITALLHEEGRRVVLVFTDGMDAPMNTSANNSTMKDIMKRADEENVMVYAIGLAGQNGGGYGPGGGHGGYGGPGGGRGGYGGGHGGRGGPGGAQLVFGGQRGGGQRGGGGGRGGDDHPDPGLPKLAAATGGGYFELTNTADLAATFKRIANELHHQYLLGFAQTATDGKTHNLTVHVTDSNMTVRARKTYTAVRESS